jgi:hypothetical protein
MPERMKSASARADWIGATKLILHWVTQKWNELATHA